MMYFWSKIRMKFMILSVVIHSTSEARTPPQKKSKTQSEQILPQVIFEKKNNPYARKLRSDVSERIVFREVPLIRIEGQTNTDKKIAKIVLREGQVQIEEVKWFQSYVKSTYRFIRN